MAVGANQMVLKKIFFMTYFFLLLASCAVAEEALVFDLGDIVVSEEKDVLSEAPSTLEIKAQDIAAKNAQAVNEALDFVPGVRITVGQKNEPYIMLRGFNQDKVLILLDGIPIASPAYGYVDLDQIPVESIAKIKVIKGAVSPLYGANTLAGVINIITKKPGKKPCLELNSTFGENDTQFYTINYGTKPENVSFWFSAGHRQSEGFNLSRAFKDQRNEDGGLRENSYYEKNSFSLKLGQDKDEENKLTAFLNYIDNNKGIPPHVSSTTPKYWRFTSWKRWLTALACESRITESLSLKGRVFYDKYDNILKSYDDASYTTLLKSSSWKSTYDDYAAGGSIYLYLEPKGIHFLKGAVNFKDDVHKEQDDINQPWETYEIQTYSFGFEDDIEISDKLSLSLGSSFDLFEKIKTYTGQTGDDVSSFNPLLGANYVLNPKTSIYSSIAKRTNFPTITQLYSNTSGNPNLKEQENINYELGIKRELSQIAKIECTYFHNNVKNLIDRANRDAPFLNTGRSLFAGAETNIETKLGENFSSRFGYTYLNARDRNPEFFGRSAKELSYVPKHKADIELRYLTDFGPAGSLLGAYHGKRYFYDSKNAQQSLGGYFVWNTKITYPFLKNWEASIHIENIFERNYQEEEGYPQPGRNFIFNIKGIF